MKNIKKNIVIILLIIFSTALFQEVSIKAAENIKQSTEKDKITDEYVSYYFVNGKGQYMEHRYKYPSEAYALGIPEECFQEVGTFKYIGKLDETSYLVITYIDPEQGHTPSETKKYLKSEYIFWSWKSDTPIIRKLGDSSQTIQSSLYVRSSNGMFIEQKNDETPIVSIQLNEDNPDLITNCSKELNAIKKKNISSSDVGGIFVKILTYTENLEYLFKDIAKTDWQKVAEFDKPESVDSITSSKIGASRYNSNLDHIRAVGYVISDNYKLEKNNDSATLCYNITYPEDTPNDYKVEERSLTVSYNFNIIGGGCVTNIDKDYVINYSSTGKNQIDINDLEISMPTEDFYTGNEVTPKVSIYHYNIGDKCYLKENENFKVTYENNVNLGTGKAIIEGIGLYKGKVIKTFKISLNKPVLKIDSSSIDSVSISWSEVPGATFYMVYYHDGGIRWKGVRVEGTSRKFTELCQNKEYKYKVRAYYNGNKSYSYESNIVTAKTSKLGTPTLKIDNSSIDSVSISWNKVPEATSYLVSYHDGIKWKAKWVEGTSTKFTELCSNKEYRYKVRAYYDGNRSYSDESNIVTAKTSKLGTPTLKVNSSSVSSVNISWNSLPKATSYKVFYSCDGINWNTTNVRGTSWKFDGLCQNTQYKFKVKACDKFYGESDDSNIVTAKTSKLETPKGLSINITYNSKTSYYYGTVYWSKVKYATSYRIDYSADNGKGWLSTTASNNSIKLRLDPNRKYIFKVRAYCSNNKAYSNYSSTISAKTPQKISKY